MKFNRCTFPTGPHRGCLYNPSLLFRDKYSFDEGGIGKYVVSLLVLTPGYFLLLSLIEYEYTTNFISQKIKNLKKKFRKSVNNDVKSNEEFDEPEDDDVLVSFMRKIKF